MQEIDRGVKIFVGRDLDGHIGKDGRGYERVHRGHGYGENNEAALGYWIFAMSFNLILQLHVS